MPHDDIGHVGILLLRELLQPVDVPHKDRGRVLLTEIPVLSLLPHRLPVSQVVFPGHHEPFLHQKPGELLVPFHIFRHAVHHLQDTSNPAPVIRPVPDCMQPALPVPGVKIEFFLDHSASSAAPAA